MILHTFLHFFSEEKTANFLITQENKQNSYIYIYIKNTLEGFNSIFFKQFFIKIFSNESKIRNNSKMFSPPQFSFGLWKQWEHKIYFTDKFNNIFSHNCEQQLISIFLKKCQSIVAQKRYKINWTHPHYRFPKKLWKSSLIIWMHFVLRGFFWLKFSGCLGPREQLQKK